jgi:hypothetical protein
MGIYSPSYSFRSLSLRSRSCLESHEIWFIVPTTSEPKWGAWLKFWCRDRLHSPRTVQLNAPLDHRSGTLIRTLALSSLSDIKTSLLPSLILAIFQHSVGGMNVKSFLNVAQTWEPGKQTSSHLLFVPGQTCLVQNLINLTCFSCYWWHDTATQPAVTLEDKRSNGPFYYELKT